MFSEFLALHWRYNDHDGVTNHQPRGCLLNRLFRPRSKKTSKPRVTGLCAGNSPRTKASNADFFSIWWRHHGQRLMRDILVSSKSDPRYNSHCIAFQHVTYIHDDVIKWKHFPRYWPFVRGVHRSPVNSPHKGQWRGALMFSLICARMNGWVNNGEAGDLRRHRTHYDVIVMWLHLTGSQWHPNISMA